MEIIAYLVIGAVLGAITVFLFYRGESAKKESEISQLRNNCSSLSTELAGLKVKLEEQNKAAEEKLALLNNAKEKLSDAFKALSAEALKSNNNQFLDLAKTKLENFQTDARAELEKRQQAVQNLVKPISDSLASVDTALKKLEQVRAGAYSSIETQIKSMSAAENNLKEETARLVAALSKPSTGGLWGQMQLRNAVELAGMTKNCDFVEQQSASVDGGRIQPDMIIRLPRDRMVVVDSKLSFQTYIDSTKETNDSIRRSKLREYVKNIKTHISNLSAKGYWEQFQPGLECVVLFLPGEVFFSAALQEDSDLIKFGIERKILLASPITLIALLLGIAYDWRQEQIAENAIRISELGKELYNRISTFVGHFASLQKNLDGAVKAYNDSVGSLESRVLVTARKFKELGAATGDEIQTLPTIDTTTRTLAADNLGQVQKENNNPQ